MELNCNSLRLKFRKRQRDFFFHLAGPLKSSVSGNGKRVWVTNEVLNVNRKKFGILGTGAETHTRRLKYKKYRENEFNENCNFVYYAVDFSAGFPFAWVFILLEENGRKEVEWWFSAPSWSATRPFTLRWKLFPVVQSYTILYKHKR